LGSAVLPLIAASVLHGRNQSVERESCVEGKTCYPVDHDDIAFPIVVTSKGVARIRKIIIAQVIEFETMKNVNLLEKGMLEVVFAVTAFDPENVPSTLDD
jgi:hypothetical protein